MVFAETVAEELASGLFYRNRPFYLSPPKLESDYAPVRYERELRLFRSWCAAGEVLDVGCSTGGFLHQLGKRFPKDYNLLGIDLPSAALDYARSRGVPVNSQSFLDLDLGSRRFDAVTFWAVLEHVPHPKAFLEKAGRVLKRGGYCFILVPNLKSLAIRLLGPKYRYIMAEHLNYFTPATLKVFAQRQDDLEIMHSGSTHFNPVVIWQDCWRGQAGVPDEDRASLLKTTTAWKQAPLLKPIKLAYDGLERALAWMDLADNLTMVLRKKVS